jgi:hypothetical protein
VFLFCYFTALKNQFNNKSTTAMNALKMSGVLVVLALLLTLASCGPTYVRGGYGHGPRYGYGYRPYNYGYGGGGYYGYRRAPVIIAPPPVVVRPYSSGRQGYGNYGNGGGNYGGGRSYGGGRGGRSRGPR